MDELAAAARGPLMKLSQLQKFILVALSEPRYAALRRKAFRRLIKERYYGRDSTSIAAVLSRALCRLEERDLIVRRRGHWQLSTTNPLDNGVTTAFLAWAAQSARYARCGLNGPPLEALGIKPKTEQPLSQPAKKGVHVPGFD